MPPRRVSTLILTLLLVFASLLVFSTSRSNSETAAAALKNTPELFKGVLPKFDVPDFRFSFQKSSQKPPEQRNSTSGGSSWYSDWKWLNPFSSSITLDEERIVLPPSPERPPVYTYYESVSAKEEEASTIDAELLSTWRRAWWAKGFRPIVLSEAEAMNNPLYQTLQGKDVSSAMKFEISRWLAWGQMGTGLLSSWHCVPMASYDDDLLVHLRRGQFEQLTRFEGVGSGLFAGEKARINDAIMAVLSDLKLNTYKTMMEAINTESFKLEKSNSIAHYDSGVIRERYPPLAEMIVKDPSKGRRSLNGLINSHLHTVWKNKFSKGLQVLKPLPAHTTALTDPSLRLAKLVSECPESVLQSSCPPNKPKCSPCVGSKMDVKTPTAFRNATNLYTISTVPHPHTLVSLNSQSDSFNVSYIRRNTGRDQWLTAVTRDVLGDGRGGPSRLLAFKNIVASEANKGSSLWFIAEGFPPSVYPQPTAAKSPTVETRPEEKLAPLPEEWLDEMEWHFGFHIPRAKIAHGESFPPVPGPERWSNGIPGLPAERRKGGTSPSPPSEVQLAKEIKVLRDAHEMFQASGRVTNKMVTASEAWNLADTEAWKFVRAYRARSVVERQQWQAEESGFGKKKSRWWRS